MTVVATIIVIASLGPLHALVAAVRRREARLVAVRLRVSDLAALDRIAGEASNRRIEVADLRVDRDDPDRNVRARLRIPAGAVPSEVLSALASIDGVDRLATDRSAEED